MTVDAVDTYKGGRRRSCTVAVVVVGEFEVYIFYWKN